MLQGVVRRPLSSTTMTTTTTTKTGSNDNGAAAATVAKTKSQQQQQQQQQHHHHHHEGKETIIPLVKRPVSRRLDVYPFAIGYAILIFADAHHHNSANDAAAANNDGRASLLPVIVIDVLYAALLTSQLALFLKCQWDPLWHAGAAYRRHRPRPTDASDATKKIGDMRSWTHCLVVPPNPYNAADSGSGGGGGKTAQTVRPEQPGIVPLVVEATEAAVVGVIRFRGWTYRCCINTAAAATASKDGAGGDVHYDAPMESIWQTDGEQDLEEISDEEDENETTESSIIPSTTAAATTTTTMPLWEPRFRRLRFPVDLPLPFYSARAGHASPSALSRTARIYGLNRTLIPLPSLSSLLTQQLLQPMFLFQLLCVLLWCMDEYWMYAIFTLGTLVLFEGIQALNRFRSVKRLREEVGDGGGERRRVECYRADRWMSLPTSQLVVGDVISLVSPSIHNSSNSNDQGRRKRNTVRGAHDHERGSTIPADLLLLNGRAVVNEAMLTGESVPQVKESMEVGEEGEGGAKGGAAATTLDLSDGSAHKRCVLFGGTVLMDHRSSERDESDDASTTSNSNGIPTPPNKGLTCFVLRTGFDTVQGSLLRTLAYHAEAGGGGGSGGGGEGVNAKETFLFLLLLLLCALISAGAVVRHAWGDVTRNRFKLALHVVIIVTSVIPPELPMELSLAVTTSLGELVKRYQVYCTEPFRIPLAGLVDVCCFDKTGTLTSDELRLHGVGLPGVGKDDNGAVGGGDDANGSSNGGKKEGAEEDLILFDDILSEAKSAAENDETPSIGALLPRETLRVMVGCQSLAITHVLAPGADGRTTVQTELCGDPLEKAVVEGCGFTIHPRTDCVVEKASLMMSGGGVASALNGGGSSIKVLHRFAFSSKLRRMTVLATDAASADGDDAGNNTTLWALTKGAPEALKPMLDPDSLPADYEASYLRHMTLGRRVLALAYRNLGTNTNNLQKWKSSREKVEQSLTFGGLLIMDSPLKADSARIIKELRMGLSCGSGSDKEKKEDINNNVVMVTGDAVLTAAEVARRVGIVDAVQEFTYELVCRDGNSDGTKEFVFRPLDHSIIGATQNGNDDEDGKNDDLLPYTPSNLGKLRELVRDGKANFCVTGDVLTKLAIHAVDQVTNAAPSATAVDVDDRAILNHPAAKSALSQLVPIISVFARHAPRHKEAVILAFNASGRHTLMCGDGTNDVGALKAAHVGVSIVSVPDLEAKQRSAEDVIRDVKAEEKRERKKAKKSGKSSSSSTKKPKKSRADRVERSLQALAEAEDELNFVSLGNASMASPFTSRKTSVRCCKDILQQGRCTLVTMITIYKILGVQCLVNALVLTKLHQKGVKQGDRQLTAVGLVVSILFLFVTRGKPLPKLSPNKPPSSVLCKGTLISIALQFGIHFVAIMAVTNMSDAYVDPYDPSIVPDGPFHPNTLNTATFLITVLATINAFLVNYRGRPYMEDLTDNKLLYRGIQGCYFVLGVCALEVFTPLNQLMQLSPMPSTGPPLYYDDVVIQEGSAGGLHHVLLEAVSLVGFRTMLCVVMCLDTVVVALAEKGIRSVLDT